MTLASASHILWSAWRPPPPPLDPITPSLRGVVKAVWGVARNYAADVLWCDSPLGTLRSTSGYTSLNLAFRFALPFSLKLPLYETAREVVRDLCDVPQPVSPDTVRSGVPSRCRSNSFHCSSPRRQRVSVSKVGLTWLPFLPCPLKRERRVSIVGAR